MLKRHRTTVIFGAAVTFSLLSIALLFTVGQELLALLIVSVALNIWCVIQSDRGGFVRSSQIRRAYEPARRFNGAQTLVVVLLIMLQCSLGTYVLLS